MGYMNNSINKIGDFLQIDDNVSQSSTSLPLISREKHRGPITLAFVKYDKSMYRLFYISLDLIGSPKSRQSLDVLNKYII